MVRKIKAGTLLELLDASVQQRGSSVLFQWLENGDAVDATLTPLELQRKAELLGSFLAEVSSRRDTALLLYPPGPEFIVALFACCYAGIIAVPAYVPSSTRDPRIYGILRDCGAAIVLTQERTLDAVRKVLAVAATDPLLIATDRIPSNSLVSRKRAARLPAVAYLQYTSGSTSLPRGVMISHKNLLSNLNYIHAHGGFDPKSVSVSWLPHFHDMGLVYGILQPIYSGIPAVLMAPTSFLHRPDKWLSNISRFRGTHSGAPNFAYDLCLNRVTDDQAASIDLSSWRVAFNGPEPVRAETMRRFAARFGANGFDGRSFYPVYGLAEATLKVTSGGPGAGVRVARISRREMERGFALLSDSQMQEQELVACGRTAGSHRVRIVDPVSRVVCEPGRIGEIWVSGPSVAAGYWRNAEATELTFDAKLSGDRRHYLRTGDLGFLQNGELFIAGRLKDSIIIRGRNLYPQDIEAVSQESHAGVRENGVVAFALQQKAETTLVIVAEVERRYRGDHTEVISAIRKAIAECFEVSATRIALIRSGSLARTSSGKVQRGECRRRLMQGLLPVIAESVLTLPSSPGWSLTPEQLFERAEPERFALLVRYLSSCVLVNDAPAPVAPDASLASLGIDSLGAFDLKRRIERTLGVEVPGHQLLELTISEVAERIMTALTAPRDRVAVAARGTAAPAIYPLSPSQEYLWTLHQLEPESCAYNESAVFRLKGKLEGNGLTAALKKIVERYSILRTSFHESDGIPYQQVQNDANIDLPLLKLAPDDAVLTQLQSAITAQIASPFDIASSPLLRLCLLEKTDAEHYLLIVAHHLVCDGSSLALIAGELAELYAADIEARQAHLPSPVLQYGDYAVWQREWLKGGVLEEQLKYWKEQLEGMGVLELATDRARPVQMKHEGASVEVKLGQELSEQLKEMSRREGVTLYMTLLGGLQVLLSKYAGQKDVAVGTAVANRNGEETERLIGFFVNTLVMRTDLRGDPTVEEVLGRVRGVALEAYRHQDVPFEKVVEEVHPERDLSRTPLFQVMLVLQPKIPTVCGGGVEFNVLATPTPVVKFDLTWRVVDTSNEVRSYLDYNASLYEAGTVERMVGHLGVVLGGMVEDRKRRISQIGLLQGAERERVLRRWNGTERAYRAVSVHELVEEEAERSGDGIAVECGGEQISYGELNRRGNQLAHYLREQGVGVETRVGICLERSLEMVVALLGVLKAGGAYVPLDPGYPPSRLEYMVRDCGAQLVLTRGRYRQQLGKAARLLEWEQHGEAMARRSGERVSSGVEAANLAYVIYTSGSTGAPKGVAITHGGIVRLVTNTNYIEIGSGDRFLQFASLSFDAATFEVWGSLVNGARLVVYTPQVPSLHELAQAVELHDITVLWLTSGLFHQVVERGLGQYRSLKYFLAGGDVLSPGLVRRALEELPETVLINGYGPTENTTFSCCAHIRSAMRVDRDNVAIGKPIANTQAYVLDEEQEPVPVGVRGELYLGGAGLARGYEGRAELTAERFVPSRFSEAGERLYRTGDQVRWREDGELEFIGRIDQQVKVRGYRIELGEIEAALEEQGGVRQAVVVVREGEGGDKRLVAYVVGGEGEAEQAGGGEKWRAELRKRLPEYMVPVEYVELAELPLTGNGKIDRKALPEVASVERGSEAAEPRNAEEEILKGMWSKLLRIEPVGVEDNFFQLGGHSLLATQVMSRVGKVFGVELPLRVLFEEPTIAGLAARIREQAGVATTEGLKLEKLEGDRSRLPLSYGQQRLWFLEQLEPGSTYNVGFAVRLWGELNRDALAWSLQEIVKRHEMLRTVFVEEKGGPVQRIRQETELALEEEDLCAVPDDEEREAALREAARQESRRPFQLSRDRLLRVKLVRMAEHEHVLLMSMHHIICDGWSIGVMVEELGRLYEGYGREEGAGLEELKIQYGDYAVWQREWLKGGVLEEQLKYWKEQLEGMGVLELATDRARPVQMKHEGASVEVKLGQELSEQLKEMSRREGVTLYMTLLGGLQVLLSKYAGQKDVAVGTAVANRNGEETERLIGFFVNTLVMRTDLRGDPTVEEVLGRVRGVALEAYRHQDVPFEKVVEEVHPERDLSRTPLFQVMLVLQNTGQQQVKLKGVRLERLKLPTEDAKFDLLLELREEEEGIEGELIYARELYEAGTVERMVGHLGVVLGGMVEDRKRRISQIGLLQGAERERVLRRWNGTERAYRAVSVHELVEEEAERSGDGIAVECGGEQISYGELNRRGNQLAHYLREQGVGVETRVGICLERSLEMVVALLGVLKAGGAYVPLDPGYPPSRLEYMVRDCGAQLVLTRGRYRQQLGKAARLLEWEQHGEAMARRSGERVSSGVEAANLAYVIYTSGSTGAPKGVAITHGGIVRLVTNTNYIEIGSGDRFLQFASLSFDAATFEVWGSLVNGARLVVYTPQVPSLHELAQAVELHDITVLWLTSGLFHQVVERGLGQYRSLKYFLAGGDVLSPGLVRRALEELPETVLINGYGPTENTTFSCCAHIRSAMRVDRDNVAIGKPIANTQAYVLDEEQEPVPVGVRGELYLGGAGLARGYEGRAELTAERFVPSRFSEAGERLYRTGDQVRWREDGELEFIGRIDQQVKVRGYRIELGEIEAALEEQGGVRQAVVVVREGEGGDKRLVAYVVGGEGEAEQAGGGEKWRAELRKRLPEYMVPVEYVELAELPLTGNGKIDRKALPEVASVERGSEAAEPRNAEEEILKGMWSKLLRIEPVGVEDNFFQLGGHSLLATQVMSRVGKVFGVELPLRVLFEEPTIAGLAARIREQAGVATTEGLKLEKLEGDRSRLPLSYGQQRLWFLEQLEPGSTYNVGFAVRLWGELNRDALAWSLQEIVKRHEMLRTVFVEEKGGPVQRIRQETELALEEEDLCAVPDDEEREAALREAARQESRRPFQLSRDRLLRVKLVRMAEHEHVLLMSMHHIICDGWSIGVMVEELGRLYEGYGREEGAGLEELKIQYGDYAVWQREWLKGGVLEEQLKYWKEQLEGMGVLELATDRARPVQMKHEGASVEVKLGQELSEQLKEMSRREGVTLYMTLLGGLQVLLSKYAGQKDVAVGTAVANRNGEETERLIGFFVNTLVMRTDLRGDPTVEEVLGRVRGVALEAYRHQDVPFEKVVEEVHPERDLSRTPLFQVMLVLQNTGQQQVKLKGVRLERLKLPTEDAKFDLLLELREEEEGIEGELIYARELYEAGTVERMVGHLGVVLGGMVEDRKRRISQIGLLQGAERERVLRRWNGTERAYRAVSVHELVEEEAERSGDGIAVECGGEQISYGELNRRGNQLAHYLREQGVGVETRVGICLERSLEMVVALLGVLKAGGAYVPLDPGYPPSRLEYMVRDCGAQLVLTRGRYRQQLGKAARLLEWEQHGEAMARRSGERVSSGVEAANLAYVIYTSGSTGAPKGVAITHGSAGALLQWAGEVFSREELRSVLAGTSICFDLSVFEIFAPLSLGGKVVLAENALVLSERGGHQDVSLINTVPSAMAELMSMNAVPTSVQVVNLAGEALTRGLVEQIYAGSGVDRVINLYGPTEDTTYSTWCWVKAEEGSKGVAIGKPIANTQAYVLDEEQEPVPVGVRGELYLGGAGLARGYEGRAELTAERFVPSRFSEAGERLYRTGDQVRWREDGELEFIGRIDQQVKVRGYRIELGEIEAALEEQGGVRQAVVVVREGEGGDKRLVAYVVGGEGEAEQAGGGEKWRAELRKRLPEYMVPVEYVELAELPLTGNGKIDRKALPEVRHQSDLSHYIAPGTFLQRAVAQIWCGLLGVDRIGLDDNFFDLGGHSLLATQLVSRIRSEFSIDVPLRDIFSSPTLKALTEKLEILSTEQFTAEMDSILAHVESLSEEEVRSLALRHKTSA